MSMWIDEISNIPVLGCVRGLRAPVTDEEKRLLRELDWEAWRECQTLVGRAKNKDPAYLMFATRRMWFESFYPKAVRFPESRPVLGSIAIEMYMTAEKIPWYVIGLENISRVGYPIGYEKIVGRGQGNGSDQGLSGNGGLEEPVQQYSPRTLESRREADRFLERLAEELEERPIKKQRTDT